jgi:hypothetical protein
MGYGVTKGKPGRPYAGGMANSADRHAVLTAEKSKVDRVPCEDPKRRARLETDDEEWLRWYCHQDFWLPFETPHKAIIAAARDAMTNGGDAIVASERGIGKSSTLYGMVLKYALSGEQPFPVYLPYSQKDQDQGVRFWKESLIDNERIAADYPEICAPFVHAGDVAQRLIMTTWRDTGERTGARTLTGMGRAVIVFPDGRGLIGTSSMGGNPRGIHYKPKGKGSIRPTMALIDDVQTDETAISPDAVKKTVAKINGAIRGLKRAGGDFSIVIAGTCICVGDVMDHFLNRSRWHSARIACVEKWPNGWDDERSEVRMLWDQWKEKFDSGHGESSFYRANKKIMTAGMAVSSPRWYKQKLEKNNSDKRSKTSPPVDCFHGVMREYFTMGHEAFMAERQQQPVDPVNLAGPYLISPPMILKRRNGFTPMQVPDWCAIRLASSDINPSYALSTVLPGFGIDQTAAMLWHGIHPLAIRSDLPAPEFARQLFGQLTAHGRFLASLPCKPEAWGIDAGGTQFDAVVRFAAESVSLCGIQAYAMTGRGTKAYKPYGKTAIQAQIREQCHGCMDQKEGRRIRWVAWNSDYWKEIAQRAWLGEVGSPGSISIPTGDHSELAAQICNERLLGKGEVGGAMMWNWKRLPGRNDLGDAMAQSYALAAYVGIGTGGRVSKPKQKACVPMRRPSMGR